MIRTRFSDGWAVRPALNPFAEMGAGVPPWQPVTLPHDATIHAPRVDPGPDDASGAGSVGYTADQSVDYRKVFTVPEEHRGRRVVLEFEGVYRGAVVRVNGTVVAQRPYGYSGFSAVVDPYLRPGEDNEVRVEARTHRDSRWYTGCGIYRDVWLHVGDQVGLGPDALTVTTPSVAADRAVVEVAATVDNGATVLRRLRLAITLTGPDGTAVAAGSWPVTVAPGEPAVVRQRLRVASPRLWDVDDPALHSCRAVLTDGDDVVDTAEVAFGIRSLDLDPVDGLQLNGRTVKLRGACLHHDNGPLGAATVARAEERRVEGLRAAGFNALRMSHHPMSPAMLDACDRLGMLVVDETFDMWTSAKNPFDYSQHFADWWQRDVEAMVAKDRNHPSVVMYSIGNEIPEIADATGVLWNRRLAERVRALDPTRYVTNAVNGVLAVMTDLVAMGRGDVDDSIGINTLMADNLTAMENISASDVATARTEEAFGALDVAGMNYMEARYVPDATAFPHRIVLGTETFPVQIARNWPLVLDNPHVIGDFTWTGWDYLGEAGIGRPVYLDAGSDEAGGQLSAPYPQLLAGCGDIDVTGVRRAQSYLRETVFGLRTEPWIAVQRPEHHGRRYAGSPWAWEDVLDSWSWAGHEGAGITVDVYADADEVELLQDGRSLGVLPAGRAAGYTARFETTWAPGELVAVARTQGRETGRHALRSAGEGLALAAAADRTEVRADGSDLVYVPVALVDDAGVEHRAAVEAAVTVAVAGPAELAALGTARPDPTEGFDGPSVTTYDGRALAVVRPTGAGTVTVTVSAPGCADAVVTAVAS